MAIGTSTHIDGLNVMTATWYFVFAELMIFLSPSSFLASIEGDMKSGRYVSFITKPFSYTGVMFAQGLGIISARLPVYLIITTTLCFFISGGLPENIIYAPLIVVAIFLSGIMQVIFYLVIGLLYLWTGETKNMGLVWNKLIFFFGGMMFPLDIYPKIIIDIAKLTPFYSMIYLPVRMIFRTPETGDILAMFALQGFWILIFVAIAYITSRLLSRKLIVLGG